MFKSARYVLKEHAQNLFRIFSIAKYEILADMRESKLGLFWNFANPAIQVFTYWFMFSYVLKRKSVGEIPYIAWMMAGMVVWFYISPCITEGCNSVYKKVNVITKMKFPVSILPMTVVLKNLFDHFCLLMILFVLYACMGYYPTVHWFGLLYYILCAMLFAFALSLTTSVLNMLARDTKRLITACMRLLLYFTPVLWEYDLLEGTVVGMIVRCNPIAYIVNGYRNCFFYHQGPLSDMWSFGWFWGITIFLFFFGSYMMYKFKTRFIDMI